MVNGGEITLDEVAANLEAERHVILIESSGRAADALIALLTDSHPTDDDILRDEGTRGPCGPGQTPGNSFTSCRFLLVL